jgi:serine/threonine-protein kinase
VSREGQLKGKLPYMAPEQIQGGTINARTDVYGASVLLWELLVGARLFQADGEANIMSLVLNHPVPAPSSLRPDVPPTLDAITLRGLDRSEDRRFETAKEMALELEKACRLATAAEIGTWVQSIAESSLADRRFKVSRLERESARKLPGEAHDSGFPGPPPPRPTGERPVREESTMVDAPQGMRGGFLTRAWAAALGLFRPSMNGRR